MPSQDCFFLDLIEPTQLYNSLNQSFKHPAVSDTNYLLLLDTRENHEYNESHIVTAKKSAQDDKGEFAPPYDAELECKQTIVVYDGTTENLENPDTRAVICAKMLRDAGSRNPVKILKGGYEKFSALYPFLRTQKILWVPQELDNLKTYPIEIIPGSLYLGNSNQAKDPFIRKDLKIKAVVNCSTDTKLEGLDELALNIHDNEDDDLKKLVSDVCMFIDLHVEKKQVVIVFSDLACSRSAAVCIAYLMYKHQSPLQSSYEKVKSCHMYACPNTSFLQQLEDWYQENMATVSQNSVQPPKPLN